MRENGHPQKRANLNQQGSAVEIWIEKAGLPVIKGSKWLLFLMTDKTVSQERDTEVFRECTLKTAYTKNLIDNETLEIGKDIRGVIREG